MKGIPEEWRKRIDAVQPYRHRSGLLRDRDPLTLLNVLNNANKHRELYPGFGAVHIGGYAISPGAEHAEVTTCRAARQPQASA